jgi:glycosyltransferase involved in cell wall biosynthesis
VALTRHFFDSREETMHKISVVIPVHDRAAMLAEALESVRVQSCPADEIIVVDDGSTDESAAAAEAVPGVRVLRQSRLGVAAARNAGIRHSTGELIAFLDSDDLWHWDKLAIQADFMERNPGIVFSHTDEIWIRKGRRVNPPARYRKRGGDVLEACLDVCSIAASTVMARRSLFDEVGLFDETLPACEDYDLWLRTACCHRVGYIERALATRREGHAGQLSHTIPHLDEYRIRALVKLLEKGNVARGRIDSVVSALLDKTRIVLNGLEKANRPAEAAVLRARISAVLEQHGKSDRI